MLFNIEHSWHPLQERPFIAPRCEYIKHSDLFSVDWRVSQRQENTMTQAPLVGDQGQFAGRDINLPMLAVARTRPLPPGAPIAWQEGNAMSLPGQSRRLALVEIHRSGEGITASHM